MDTSKLRKFASFARSALIEQVGTRMKTVLAEKSLARRESPNAVKELEAKIKDLGEKRLIETVAYTWFNRFCALRYMDVNRYTRIGVLSPADGQFQPEILAEAKMGHIDEDLVPAGTRNRVLQLLDGSDPSNDPQGEAYRLLLVAVCNYYHASMPFMFEKIADYTELLLPDDLLSGSSIPAYTREALLPINCSPEHTDESVEVIGWLYQFYIADKKDEVFDSLKNGKKIIAENIPAATQLFTPHWIVRYLVENSLGRLWMLNHPDSKLIEQMDYYIKSEEPETDFLNISSPEEIKICDPACGSGHMLTYTFDLLYAIYREEQYPEPEIPSLILKNNLYGIEIDPRAGALAAFALTMKAREKDKRFFSRKTKSEFGESVSQNPNICVLENIKIAPDDLSVYLDKVGRNLFASGLQSVVTQWEEADNLGSLFRPPVGDVSDVLNLLRDKHIDEDLFITKVHQQVIKALQQTDYLCPKYHVTVTNPPYMGSKGMNPSIRDYARKEFNAGRSDLFAMFIMRCQQLSLKDGMFAMITMHSWMFISSFADLRLDLLERTHILSMIHLGPRAFDSIGGEVVSTTAFVIKNRRNREIAGSFFRLTEGISEAEKTKQLRNALINRNSDLRHNVCGNEFFLIPSAPIAYWVSPNVRLVFGKHISIGEIAAPRKGNTTTNNSVYLRLWPEVSRSRIGLNQTSAQSTFKGFKWIPYNKGGGYRKWYGFNEYLVNWENDGAEIKAIPHSVVANEQFFWQPGLTWSTVSAGHFSIRRFSHGYIFDNGGCCVFGEERILEQLLGLMNSKVFETLYSQINPTLNYQSGDVARVPAKLDSPQVAMLVDQAVTISKSDWDSFETSWDFQESPLKPFVKSEPFRNCCVQYLETWRRRTLEMSHIETEINRVFISSYGLESEIGEEVDVSTVSLSMNPRYRYNSDKSDMELEELLLADTIREYVSYAVGCMLGRYSLNEPGLILANQGETVADYHKRIPEPIFSPDDDNVIPVLGVERFDDDISQQFKGFLKAMFGTKHYEENLQFVENALYPDNPTAKNRKTIRDYFLREYYDHHLKLYKKRPIYWLFSSPKGTFNALIYMHRYRSETVGKVLECLRDFRDKLAHHAVLRQGVADSASESKVEKTRAVKEIATTKKQLKELEDYEKALFEVAARKIDIDLDNGVKHNYLLFGPVLRKIPGLDAKDD